MDRTPILPPADARWIGLLSSDTVVREGSVSILLAEAYAAGQRAKAKQPLPDWPRLMPADLAAQYLSVSKSAFAKLAIRPVIVAGKKRYDRAALDQLVQTLAPAGGTAAADEHWLDKLDANDSDG